MPTINLNRFEVKTINKLDTKDKVVRETIKMFIASEDLFARHVRFAGYVRSPKDNKCVWTQTHGDKKTIWMDLILYLHENDLFWKGFYYTRIQYKAGKDRDAREWQAYERLLMDFIDYILPNISGEGKITNIQNVIYADHVFERQFNPSFHIVFDGKDAYEFEGLWNEYLETLKRDYPQMLEYKKKVKKNDK